jgi:hypothetical protein
MPRFAERDVARYVDDARAWLDADERRKVIGMVVLSITVSVMLSLLVTAIVGTVARRRAATTTVVPDAIPAPEEPSAETVTDAVAGVAVMTVAPSSIAPEVQVEA